MKVEFKKLYGDSILPKKAHETDAGFDLYAHSFINCDTMKEITGHSYFLKASQRILVRVGFGMALPEGYEAQIRPRSGLALKFGLSVVNSPGTIDCGWRAEVGVILINLMEPYYDKYDDGITNGYQIKKGDRIAQMVIQKLPEVEVVEVEELSVPSERGCKGLGSSGV